MINSKDLVKLGQLIKLHGLKGHVVASVEHYEFPEDLDFLFVLIDQHPIPFKVATVRFMSEETVWLTLHDCTLDELKEIVGKDYYLLKKQVSEKGVNQEDELVGYQIYHHSDEVIGKVVGIDTQTINTLLQVLTAEGEELLIPLAEEFIVSIDRQEGKLILNLPDGLLELYTEDA